MAFIKGLPMISFIVIALCSTSALAARFDVTNRCSYTVWAAVIPIPGGGGRQINPGDTWNLDVAAGTSSARLWGRTNCQFDGSGRGQCQTGDCGGVLLCQNSGKPPTTLAEFTLNGNPNGNTDSFDISVIDGFNIPMEFSPTANCGRDIRCLAENNCPDAYHHPNDVATFTCPSGTNYRIVFCP